MIDPTRAVLEVLETVSVEDKLVAAVDRLLDQGFTVALDDFEYRPELGPCSNARAG